MAKRRSRAATELRRRRIRRVHALHAQGLSSKAIGKRLDLAPTTVRDYLNDPLRAKARKRQAKGAVAGVAGISSVKLDGWKRGGPVQGKGAGKARARGRQVRAIIGYRVGR